MGCCNNQFGTDIEDSERIVDIYGNMLFRICFVILCNQYDAEDAVQDTFIKYLTKSPTFRDLEHENATGVEINSKVPVPTCFLSVIIRQNSGCDRLFYKGSIKNKLSFYIKRKCVVNNKFAII
ncbi:ECF subfamily RNA polymerase sigma-24 subunit [Neobacillus bataviensis LMG 21833]|uniref:ECF subfamily RNA polymerase sigma-24 subunit n=1 Tax=Neobacillus bataviensis LMG 21833 TaxID=1117379 RepID=K6EE25_9BACI|nr:sigma factor [Neobacillus bataviensis]EKN71736.1 ECF subfamily RNA polymerase sigma-24 subunit [Neobacillus bataviensis LMG 21833]